MLPGIQCSSRRRWWTDWLVCRLFLKPLSSRSDIWNRSVSSRSSPSVDLLLAKPFSLPTGGPSQFELPTKRIWRTVQTGRQKEDWHFYFNIGPGGTSARIPSKKLPLKGPYWLFKWCQFVLVFEVSLKNKFLNVGLVLHKKLLDIFGLHLRTKYDVGVI